jgi:hypothetical protein
MPSKRPSDYSNAKAKNLFIQELRANMDSAYHNAFSYKLLYGKYAGQPICSVPLDYLDRMRRTSSINMARICSREIDRRNRLTDHV